MNFRKMNKNIKIYRPQTAYQIRTLRKSESEKKFFNVLLHKQEIVEQDLRLVREKIEEKTLKVEKRLADETYKQHDLVSRRPQSSLQYFQRNLQTQ